MDLSIRLLEEVFVSYNDTTIYPSYWWSDGLYSGLFENDITKYNLDKNRKVNIISPALVICHNVKSASDGCRSFRKLMRKYLDAFSLLKMWPFDFGIKAITLEAEPMEYITVASMCKRILTIGL